MQIEKMNLLEKFSKFSEHFSPKIIADLNGQQVKLGKFAGEFVWHSHENEDELFYVVKGNFVMQFRDRNIELLEGDMLVVPKGVEHCPVAKEEVWVMLFEPAATLNTGNTENEFTKKQLETI